MSHKFMKMIVELQTVKTMKLFGSKKIIRLIMSKYTES